MLRAVADRILVAAMDGYRPEGDWKQRITAIALRLREAFGQHPQLAVIWGRYASGGTGSRLFMEEALQALRASGLPGEEIPPRYHRIAILLAALIASEAGIGTLTPSEYEQGMEQFRVAVLGADPDRFPALAHFAREIRPSGPTAAPHTKRSSPPTSPGSRPQFPDALSRSPGGTPAHRHSRMNLGARRLTPFEACLKRGGVGQLRQHSADPHCNGRRRRACRPARAGHASRTSLEIYSKIALGPAQETYDGVIDRFPV
ncbi:TetR/AcrR family transcriptional regulator C-terminal domain-containing protein [Streptosporangium sp. NPDC000396]|uniref:TetR/AcrR family transcriptional regulator C-terminal domain-containing protein n=1 Tax=Streptosporangium sp. NPDC000396 TaxID=3366185 RepID=UPI003678A0D6